MFNFRKKFISRNIVEQPRSLQPRSSSKLMIMAACAAGLTTASQTAQAGGFINTSQSSVFNGMAYAGFTAPGSTSMATMFLNPATMTFVNRITLDSNYHLIIGHGKITGTAGVQPGAVFNPVFGTGTSGNISSNTAISPATYFVYPYSDRLFFGFSINAPYGNTTKPKKPWVGQLNSMTTKAKTITITPQIAYKISEMISIGIGLQIQYFSAKFISALAPFPTANPPVAGLVGDGWGVGITAGITLTPWKGTQIGIGYRSRIDQNVEGKYIAGAPLLALNGSKISGTLKLPDRLNLSIRQTINPQLDILASVEWQGWSRIKSTRLSGPLVAAAPAGLQVIPFEYKDGWFFALGGEYKYSSKLTLRAGMAYEIAPLTDQVRTTRLPDNNRIWASIGATYRLSERISVNASYSHIFVKKAAINVVPGNPAFSGAPTFAAFVGTGRSSTDIFSIGLTSKFGSKAAPVVAKY